MPKLEVVNANNVIEFNPQKANFKLKNTGGPKGDTGAQGPQGPKGETGAQGPAGASASVTVGSTTTLSPGADATVTNSGDTRNAILNFGIPTGARGPKGDTGSKGDTGPIGPKGAKGDTGAAATVQVGNTNTGAPGTNAQVTNAGNEHFAVFNFTIPRGDKGEKGATGAQGPKGPAGQDGTDGFSPIATVTQEGLDAEISITDKDGTTTATVPGFGVQVVESLPATGSSNVIYLERDSNSASGNPISIADAVQAPLKSLEIQGNTTQQTYTGSNPVHGNFTNVTEGGLTWEYNKSTGEFYVHGTAASTYSVPTYILFDTPLPAGRYTFFITEQISGARPGIGLRKANGSSRVASPITAGSLSATVDNAEEKAAYDIYLTGMTPGSTINVRFKCMLVAGTSTTTYEPYVGGTPAPNPDYPQAVQTVTGENVVKISDGQGNEQSYEVNLGKNLFDKDNAILMEGYFSAGGVYMGNETNLTAGTNRIICIECKPNTTYTITKPVQATTSRNRFRIATADHILANNDTLNDFWRDSDGTTNTVHTITTGSVAKYLYVYIGNATSATVPGGEIQAILDGIQIELGSQATSYAAYFTPIELCKIGDYQDYIYKSGGKWYVRKAVGSHTFIGNSSELWNGGGAGTASTDYTYIYTPYLDSVAKRGVALICDKMIGITGEIYRSTSVTSDTIGIMNTSGNDAIRVFVLTSRLSESTAAAWKTWLASNPITVYYALATPTDTEIANEALIAQLEAILAGGTQAGANTITLTPSAGATGTLGVEYYDSYDSYLWVNNRWEKFAHLG